MFGNNVNFLGRMTFEPEIKTLPSGTEVLNFTLARNRMKIEGKEQQADFMRFVAFGKLATTIATYVKKGDRLGVNGRLQVTNYVDKNGNNATSVEVVTEGIEFIERRADNGDNNSNNDSNSVSTPTNNSQTNIENATDGDEDYPF